MIPINKVYTVSSFEASLWAEYFQHAPPGLYSLILLFLKLMFNLSQTGKAKLVTLLTGFINKFTA